MIEMACCPVIAPPRMTTGERFRGAANITPESSRLAYNFARQYRLSSEKVWIDQTWQVNGAGARQPINTMPAPNHGQCGKLLIWKGQNFGPCPFEMCMDVLIFEWCSVIPAAAYFS